MPDFQGTRRLSGVVKWFDPSRAFGFVVADEGGPDILLHANVLRNYGQSTIADGARVVVSVQRTTRGVQAVEVFGIEPPVPERAVLEDFERIGQEEIERAPLLPARVKWFDKAKGFGFANVFGRPDDVFLHIEVLRASGLADLAPGEAVAIRPLEGNRGLMAAEIRHWDAALSEHGAEDLRMDGMDRDGHGQAGDGHARTGPDGRVGEAAQ